ncbi:MAG: NTP transferase domain-containing protein [Spirochaetaceae bacterium]|jgi:hypothetical protein|nr:NTP transferase domain-containing protein [Spirochaetaceae bacterium]
MKPLLLVLAAGMGSGYGGPKQLEPIGRNGETLLEYSVYDALRSGFGNIIVVIRRDMEQAFRETALNRMKSARYTLAYQALDAGIPAEVVEKAQTAGRTRLWGTVHAVLCGASAIDAPAFAAIRGDAFYGPETFELLGGYLGFRSVTQQKLPAIKHGYILPYPLARTFSGEGPAVRELCEIKDDCLVSLKKYTALCRDAQGVFNTAEDGSKEELPGDAPASADCWAFPRSILPGLRKYFFDFLQNPENIPQNECDLWSAADWIVKNGLLTIRALKTDAEWFCLAGPDDRTAAANRIAELTERGVYPVSLWE